MFVPKFRRNAQAAAANVPDPDLAEIVQFKLFSQARLVLVHGLNTDVVSVVMYASNGTELDCQWTVRDKNSIIFWPGYTQLDVGRRQTYVNTYRSEGTYVTIIG